MIRVRLGIPFPALEAGLRALLAEDPQLVVLGSAENESGDAADVHVVTSAALLPRASNSEPPEGVIVVGARPQDVRRLRVSGRTWGVLPMEVSAEELCAAVRAVAAGLVVGSMGLVLPTDEEGNEEANPLTEREIEILGLLSTGLANKQIAVSLGISEHTVKFHVSSLFAKMGASNRAEAVREGLQNGWITL